MAVTIKRSDLFPVGTVVKAYPLSAGHWGVNPAGPASTEATVASNGSLTLTLTADTAYTLHAEVAGEHRYLNLEDSSFTEPGTLQERVKAQREATGAL